MHAPVLFQTDPAPASVPILSSAEIASRTLAPPPSPENLNPERVSCAPGLRLKVNVVLSGSRVRPPNPPASGRLWDRFRFTLGPLRKVFIRRVVAGPPAMGAPESGLCFLGW